MLAAIVAAAIGLSSEPNGVFTVPRQGHAVSCSRGGPTKGKTPSTTGPSKARRDRQDPVATTIPAAAEAIRQRVSAAALEFEPVLQHDDFKTALKAFGACQSASTHLLDGENVDLAECDRFHNNVDETLRALDQIPSAITSISVSSAKALRKELAAVKALANRTSGLEEPALVALDPGASAQDAVSLARRMLAKVDLVLYGRGLGLITGEGRAYTKKELQPALQELLDSINAMVDPEGVRVLQVDAKGAPLSRQLARVDSAFDGADKSAGVLCNVHPHTAVRERVGLVLADLKVLRQKLMKVKELAAKPKLER